MNIFAHCPQPPGWRVDWDSLDVSYQWIRDLKGCAQDPVWHGEGDVWIHTRMVLEAMAAAAEWRALDEPTRQIVFSSAILHDVAKPACSKVENGRIRSRGHSVRGSIMARRILWEMDVPFAAREAICGLIRHHQLPYYELKDRWVIFNSSQTARTDWLCELARADVRGRLSADQHVMLRNIDMFEEHGREERCLTGPRAFPSAHARFLYFHKRGGTDPDYRPYEDPHFEVTLLSGLPGSGKDRWISRCANGSPIVSLDAVRDELDVSPNDEQGSVIAAAREQSWEFLRAKQPFVFNATNVSREMRSRWIRLFTQYAASVRIVYVEAPPSRLWRQNREREKAVPESAIDRMMDRWEVPDLAEAHEVEHVGS